MPNDECRNVALLTPEALLRLGLSPTVKVLDLQGSAPAPRVRMEGRAAVSIKWREQGTSRGTLWRPIKARCQGWGMERTREWQSNFDAASCRPWLDPDPIITKLEATREAASPEPNFRGASHRFCQGAIPDARHDRTNPHPTGSYAISD
jgi:hypothetical protein